MNRRTAIGCLALAAAHISSGAFAQELSRAPRATYLSSESSPLVALRLIVPAGSQYDPPGKEGLAALTAAMIAKGGTQELTYDQLLERFYPMAAGLNGQCFKEIAVFSGLVHRDNVAQFENLAAAMVTRPRFAPEDFDRLKTEARNYLTTVLRGGDDEELGKAGLLLSLYPPGHPYAHVDEGTIAGLEAITLDDVKAFHAAHYTRDLHLGIAGGETGIYGQALAQALAELPPRSVMPPPLPAPAQLGGLDVLIIHKPSADATAISMGFPLPITRTDDDFYTLAVAASYLGEHRTFNGRLMQDLRGKRGLNYGDYAYIEDFVQEGFGTFPVPNNPRRQQAFSIWLRPVPHDKAVFALRAALWELDTMVKQGLSPQDFGATRDFLRNYSKLWVQSLERRLGYAMEGQFYGRKSLVEELQERLPELTVEQVNAAVRRYLTAPGMKVAIVTSDAEGLAAALRSGEPSPMVYDTEGTPEDVLAEDKLIERFGLGQVNVRIIPVDEMFER